MGPVSGNLKTFSYSYEKSVFYKVELGTVVLPLLISIFVSLIPGVGALKLFRERKGEADQKWFWIQLYAFQDCELVFST